MSSENQNNRDRLKEEYKEHYRHILESKEKLRRSRYVQNVNKALHQLNRDELLETMDDFLHNVRSKVANFESRLDVALDHLMEDHNKEAEMHEFNTELRKERAKETLRQVREEMGILYSEIERKAENINVEKTIGQKRSYKDSVKPENDENSIEEAKE